MSDDFSIDGAFFLVLFRFGVNINPKSKNDKKKSSWLLTLIDSIFIMLYRWKLHILSMFAFTSFESSQVMWFLSFVSETRFVKIGSTLRQGHFTHYEPVLNIDMQRRLYTFNNFNYFWTSSAFMIMGVPIWREYLSTSHELFVNVLSL